MAVPYQNHTCILGILVTAVKIENVYGFPPVYKVIDAMDEQNLVTEGASVILKKGKNMKVFKILRKQKVFLEKRHFALDPVIGHPYGSSWELQNGQLVPVSEERESHDIAQKIDEGGADNRGILDDMTSQKLDKDDITSLKEQGKTGQEIIDHLVQNSSTFNEKTVFSKAKYLKKKQNKHIMKFVVLRPSTRLLCELYFNKISPKHIQLRMDTLAQMLSAANVQSGSRVMVVEQCQGLLVGAVMERMAGNGTIVQFHSEDRPVHTALDAYGFPKQAKEILKPFHLTEVCPHLLESAGDERKTSGGDDGVDGDSVAMVGDAVDATIGSTSVGSVDGASSTAERPATTSVQEARSDAASMEEEVTSDQVSSSRMDTDDQTKIESAGEEGTNSEQQPFTREKRKLGPLDEEKMERKRQRREALMKTKDLLLERNMDTLLIASKFHPAPLLLALIDMLALSRPFAVYSALKEPLVECYTKLRDRGGVINIRLTETWLRDYQVLPNRTHPMITMSAAGGYLLTGTLVAKG